VHKHIMEVYWERGGNADDEKGPSVSKHYTINTYTDEILCFHNLPTSSKQMISFILWLHLALEKAPLFP
jgi:hypothetical protein